jgi:serine/threonine protein phosphatase PrpC
MRVAVGAKSDVGRVREGNEDSYLVDEPLFVVADGMGGHLAGDVASSTAIDVIASSSKSADAGNPDSLAVLLREANKAIYEKARADDRLRGMGTTCTLLMIRETKGHVAHVGDSRAYLQRDGELSQLTEDHSLVGRMVKEGRLSAEEAESHPQRSIITRALGVDSDVDVDLLSLDLRERDRILLCSDGLTSMVANERIQEILGRTSDPQKAANELVALANDAGGEDNITVVLVDISSSSSSSAPSPHITEETSRPETKVGKTDGSDPRVAPEGDTVIGMSTAAAARTDTPAHESVGAEGSEEKAEAPKRRSWKRRVIAPLIVLALLVGAGYAVLQYVLDRSFFVGVNDNDLVTIYRGLPDPDEFLGVSLNEVEEETALEITELPAFRRDDIRNSKKFSSLDDARAYVEKLESNAEELRSREENRRRRREKKS